MRLSGHPGAVAAPAAEAPTVDASVEVELAAELAARPRARAVTPGYLYVAADAMTLVVECALYIASAAPLVLLLRRLHPGSALAWLPLAVAGYLLMAVVFLLLLVATKRLLIGDVPSGRYFLDSPRAWRWIAADRVIKILVRSPFSALVTENACFRHLFYLGMGARMHYSVMLGNGVRLPEPWALRIGRQVLIGDQAMVSGHKVERGVVTLGLVEIGDHCVIGARSLILPNTAIGEGAIVGAQSVVVQGTRIPPGETWAGNPAQRVSVFAAAAASAPSAPGVGHG